MKSMILSMVTTAFLIVGIHEESFAAPEIDQQQLTSNMVIATRQGGQPIPIGQTFTPVISGKLSGILFAMDGRATAGGTISYSIYSGGQLLGSKTDILTANNYDRLLNIYPVMLDLGSMNINVIAGRVYTAVITEMTGGYGRGIMASSTNPYARGEANFSAATGNQPRLDLTFVTYVDKKNRVNVAFKKPASQSSTTHGAVSSKAVDGNTDGDFGHESVTHTALEFGSWWEVDLQEIYAIDSIEVFNRTDCCPERLSNFTVQILDENRVVTGQFVRPGLAGTQNTFWADGSRGRYVRVRLNGAHVLSLAEVQAWVDSSAVLAQ